MATKATKTRRRQAAAAGAAAASIAPDNPPASQSRAGESETRERDQSPLSPIRENSHERSRNGSARSRNAREAEAPEVRSTHSSSIAAEHLRENLYDFAEYTNEKYDTLADELERARAQQEALNKQLEDIQERARQQRAEFAQDSEAARERVAETTGARAPAREQPENIGQSASYLRANPRAVDDDGVTYADRDEVIERSRNNLFRPRGGSETTAQYENRLNAQTRYLAQEHYRVGTEKRNAQAERWWQERMGPGQGNNNRGEYPRQFRRYRSGHGPPGDEGDSSPSEQGEPRGPGNPHARANNMPRGRGGDNGPPGDDGDPSTPSRETSRSRSRGPHDSPRAGEGGRDARRPARARHFTRSPTYFQIDDRDTLIAADKDDPDAKYIDRQLEVIRAAIRARVSWEAPDIPAMKNLKNIPNPEKFAGLDDSEGFMAWLKSLLRWLALTRVTGPDLDMVRVQLMGQYLTDSARRWYDDTVDSLDGVGSHWDFEQVVCALYRRFIHKSTARSAAEQFSKVRFRKETGVLGLYEALVNLARKMPELPDTYTFKKRFIEALPEDICVPMLKNRKISVEQSTPAALRKAAIRQENANRAVNEYLTTARHNTPRDHSKQDRGGERRETRHHAGAPDRHRHAQGSQIRPRPTHDGRRPVANRAQARAERPSNSRAPLGTQAQGNPVPAGHTARNAASTQNSTDAKVQCYNCKEYGHYASKCPRASAPRLRAARVVEATPEVEEAPPEGDEATGQEEEPQKDETDLPEGEAMYESEEEYYDPDGSQYCSSEEYEAAYSDEEEDAVWFGAMRRMESSEEADRLRRTVHEDLVGPTPRARQLVVRQGDMAGLYDLHEYIDNWGLIRIGQAPRDAPEGAVVIDVLDEDGLNEIERVARTRLANEPEEEESSPPPLVSPTGENDDMSERLARWNTDDAREISDLRAERDALRDQLNWTRHQLAQTILREHAMLREPDVELNRRVELFEDHLARMRPRILTELAPLSLDLGDEAFEGPEDPQYITEQEASDALLAAILETFGTGIAHPEQPAMRAMRTHDDAPAHTYVTRARSGRRPLLSESEQECIVILLRIHGLEALTLLDCGSTTQLVDNSFADVSGAEVVELENPAILQLGCAGSRSKINFGTTAPITLGEFGADVYFDIANLDRYDAVLGTPFLRRFGVLLDFKNNCAVIDGVSFPALTKAQVVDQVRKRGGHGRAGRPQTKPPTAQKTNRVAKEAGRGD